MFDMTATGLVALKRDIAAAGEIPSDVKREMVEEQTKIVEDAIIYNAATMLQGPYYEGAVARSPKHKKPRVSKNGATAIIKFEGTQHGNRLGEIAFVNEYGKTNQPGRPFIKTALRESSTPAAEAARKVLHKHLKEHNL